MRTSPRARWGTQNQRDALREGWEVILSGKRGEEIQRDDDQDTFADDAAALAHVRACAAAGSRLHRAALEFVRQERGEGEPSASAPPLGEVEVLRSPGRVRVVLKMGGSDFVLDAQESRLVQPGDPGKVYVRCEGPQGGVVRSWRVRLAPQA